jgi:hypothetical protein
MRADQARAYVESLLKKLTDSETVIRDGDGDYPIRFQNCLYYVRVVGSEEPLVQVFSVAVADVDSSLELLTELNTLNADIRFARAFHLRRQVLIETDLLAEALDPAGFANACNCIATVTLEMAPSMAARYGGRLTFAEEPAEAETPAPRRSRTSVDAPTGQYL